MRTCQSFFSLTLPLPTSAAHIREVGNAVLNGAHALGLKTHELSFDSGNFELLGLSFSDTGLLGPSVRRKGKLWQALPELLRIRHASSRLSLLGTFRRWLWSDESFSVSVVRPAFLQAENSLVAERLNGCGRACPS